MKLCIQIMALWCFIVSACGSSDNQVSKENNENDTVRTETDTMTVQPPPPSLSPGTARIRATIEKVILDEENAYLHVTINQVLQHGPSTPPLAPEKMLNIKASSFKQNARQTFNDIEEGEQHELTVRFKDSPIKQASHWTLHNLNFIR